MKVERREYLEMQLSAYLDGELSPDERAEVEAWLDADPQARRLLDELRAISGAVHALPRARASEELLGNLRTRLEREALLDNSAPPEAIRRASSGSWGSWLAAAAVIALTFTAGYFTWTLRNDKQVSSPQYAFDEKAGRPTQDQQATEGETRGRPASKSFASKTSEAAPTPNPALIVPPASPAAVAAKPSEEPESLTIVSAKQPRSSVPQAKAKGEAPAATDKLGKTISEVRAEEETEASFGFQFRASVAGDGTDGRLLLGSEAAEGKTVVPNGELADSSSGREQRQTKVVTLAFADSESREKAIETLRRGASYRHFSQLKADTPHASPATANELRKAELPEGASAAGGPDSHGTAQPETAEDLALLAAGSAESRHAKTGGETRPARRMADRGFSARLNPVQVDRTAGVNVLRIEVADQASAGRVVAMLDDEARAGGAKVLVKGVTADDWDYRRETGKEVDHLDIRSQGIPSALGEAGAGDADGAARLHAAWGTAAQTSQSDPLFGGHGMPGGTGGYGAGYGGMGSPAGSAKSYKDDREEGATAAPSGKMKDSELGTPLGPLRTQSDHDRMHSPGGQPGLAQDFDAHRFGAFFGDHQAGGFSLDDVDGDGIAGYAAEDQAWNLQALPPATQPSAERRLVAGAEQQRGRYGGYAGTSAIGGDSAPAEPAISQPAKSDRTRESHQKLLVVYLHFDKPETRPVAASQPASSPSSRQDP